MSNSTMKSKTKSKSATQQTKEMSISAPRQIQDITAHKSAASATSTHDVIARRAYEIYVEKGYPQGQSEQIWQQAEKEVRERDLATFLA
jgi:hypothetical protein